MHPPGYRKCTRIYPGRMHMEIHAHRDTRTCAYVYITALVCGRLPDRSEMQIQLGKRATSGNLSGTTSVENIKSGDCEKNVNATAISLRLSKFLSRAKREKKLAISLIRIASSDEKLQQLSTIFILLLIIPKMYRKARDSF